MNPALHVVRLGLDRGWVEFRNSLTNPQDIGFNAVSTVAIVVVLFFQRDATVPGTTISLASFTLPSILGMLAAFNGLIGAVGTIAVEREDGTLLRAKAVPQGMLGYLIGRVALLTLQTLISMVIVLVAGVILMPELARAGIGGLLAVLGITLLALMATLPLGAVIGSLATSPQTAAGVSMLTVGGLTAISGIFYPISALAGWLQAVAQGFPLYWLGLGMRSALLPDSMAAMEIGGSWRPVETILVLGAWTVASLLIAPPILRRMARRESGSAMQERRDRAMQRIG
ncbi:ABC transporter permease [Nonomuraea basaltis]|uniref:ABC transporter permease n=1 Tax=Nonomuraea basaltis TaxID=2495887 RepID=UPI00110C6F28|nr:ABC transporter permease [Nonomuraea basaltis]TMR98151.1 ABC transporter permease [Nonomuraea basaltis]